MVPAQGEDRAGGGILSYDSIEECECELQRLQTLLEALPLPAVTLDSPREGILLLLPP